MASNCGRASMWTQSSLNVDIHLEKARRAKQHRDRWKRRSEPEKSTTGPEELSRAITFLRVTLANQLWDNGLKLVGTLRANKIEIPIEFRLNKEREVASSLHGFHKHLTLVSYVPKIKRSVILLSSEHHLWLCDENNNKPDIIQFYNKTKGGVDCLDQMIAEYLCGAHLRWTMALFMFILDVAACNSFTLYKHRYGDIKRRDSLEKLAIDLLIPFINTWVQKLAEKKFKSVSKDF